jgi:lysophospholipase L1-like esterase
VPLQSLLAAAAEEHGATALAEDGVHPTALGHRMIADAWLEVAGL